MDILFLLIPVSLLFLCLAVWLFVWAVNNRQFEDLEKHSHDILFDNDDKWQKATHSDDEQ
jgi:cbb3-type cytochrome oxidase maturation protein